MSNNQVVIDTLMKKREQLIGQRDEIWQRLTKEINEIEDAIDILDGKRVWRNPPPEAYDDENPNYIKGTEDGI